MAKGTLPSAPQDAAKTLVSPQEAADWFLTDMAEVSGYAVADWTDGKLLSAYATFRPILTAPDPWYFAGIVALEGCKICDLFPREYSDEVLREVFARMDRVVGRDDDKVSKLTLLILGRLGMGALIMHRKVPDILLGKVMMILLGSATAAAPHMPTDAAHEQIRAALKLGEPVWWSMFNRRYDFKDTRKDEPPARLVPSVYANDAFVAQAAE
ncbi:MAG: hypothetical protein K2P94_01130 [Rhodospirillaceae bacterium]|nr:hypothetical protein [Rhodospirillaceae bacterium]